MKRKRVVSESGGRVVKARFDVTDEDRPETFMPQSSSRLYCPSCNQRFINEQALDAHIKYKMFNQGHQVIPTKTFKYRAQVLVCEEITCCFR